MPEKADDPSIENDEIVYRRIPNVAQSAFMVVDEGTGERRPSTAIFRPDEDGVSVYRDSILRSYNLDENALIRDPRNGVLSLTVGEIRAEKLGVASDAWPPSNDPHDRDAAHALIVGMGDLTKGQRKEKRRALVQMCTVLIDPAGDG